IRRGGGGEAFMIYAHGSKGERPPLTASRVILATGGLSLPKTGSDGGGYELARRLGHTVVATTPALAPLILDGDFHAGLAGISHDVELTLWVGREKPRRFDGALLWTHFGVSGPVVLDASGPWHRARLANSPVKIMVSFVAGM